MKMSSRTLWAGFIISFLSPILAVLIKPYDYPFYMFYPATPNTNTGVLRLFLANAALVLGFTGSLASGIAITWRGISQKKYLPALCLIIVFLNPLQQPIFLEKYDTYMNYQWRDKAIRLNIIGKTPEEIVQIFGRPHRLWPGAPITIDRSGKDGWDYHVLPYYLFGSNFEVFFKDGKVDSFKANDD
jgi:hypothetical protein